MNLPVTYQPVLKNAVSLVQKQQTETGAMDPFFLFGSIEKPCAVWPSYDLSDKSKRKLFSLELKNSVKQNKSEFFLLIMPAKITDNGHVYRGVVFQLETKEGYFIALSKELTIPNDFKFATDCEGFFSNML